MYESPYVKFDGCKLRRLLKIAARTGGRRGADRGPIAAAPNGRRSAKPFCRASVAARAATGRARPDRGGSGDAQANTASSTPQVSPPPVQKHATANTLQGLLRELYGTRLALRPPSAPVAGRWSLVALPSFSSAGPCPYLHTSMPPCLHASLLSQPSAVPRPAATGSLRLTPPLRLHGGCLCLCSLYSLFMELFEQSQHPDWLRRGRGSSQPVQTRIRLWTSPHAHSTHLQLHSF